MAEAMAKEKAKEKKKLRNLQKKKGSATRSRTTAAEEKNQHLKRRRKMLMNLIKNSFSITFHLPEVPSNSACSAKTCAKVSISTAWTVRQHTAKIVKTSGWHWATKKKDRRASALLTRMVGQQICAKQISKHGFQKSPKSLIQDKNNNCNFAKHHTNCTATVRKFCSTKAHLCGTVLYWKPYTREKSSFVENWGCSKLCCRLQPKAISVFAIGKPLEIAASCTPSSGKYRNSSKPVVCRFVQNDKARCWFTDHQLL